MEILYLIIWGTAILFSIGIIPVYIHTSSMWEFYFLLHFHQHFLFRCYLFFFNNSYPNVCEAITLWLQSIGSQRVRHNWMTNTMICSLHILNSIPLSEVCKLQVIFPLFFSFFFFSFFFFFLLFLFFSSFSFFFLFFFFPFSPLSLCPSHFVVSFDTQKCLMLVSSNLAIFAFIA